MVVVEYLADIGMDMFGAITSDYACDMYGLVADTVMWIGYVCVGCCCATLDKLLRRIICNRFA